VTGGEDGQGLGIEWIADGKVGKGCRLDGEGAHIEMGKPFRTGNQPFTFSCWFRTTEREGRQTLHEYGGMYFGYIIYLSDGQPRFTYRVRYAGSRRIPADVNVADGRWHHVAASADGTSISLYLDGTLKAKGERSLMGETPQDSAQIGQSSVSNVRSRRVNDYCPFRGAVDEVRIWTRALSSEEIREVYELDKGE